MKKLDYKALLNAKEISYFRYRIKHDISAGIRLGFNGTPGYVVNDHVYLERIPPEIIKTIKLTESILQIYVGKYELKPGFVVFDISSLVKIVGPEITTFLTFFSVELK